LCTLCALLCALALGAPARAQTPIIGTPAFPFDSPLATPLATPTPTPTSTVTPSPTPTVDLATAVLQVSPLRVTPEARPAGASSALLWIIAAVALVFAGAVVMAVAQRRTE
jgi:hypothetical protein